MDAPRRTARTLLLAIVAVAALAGAPAATATPSTPAIPAALPQLTLPNGGTITGPTPQHYPPEDDAAGTVCPFPIHLDFPISHVVAYTYTNGKGRAVAAYYTGPLYAKVTRTETGSNVTVNISGSGVATFAKDGSSVLYGLGPFASNQHPGDTPGPELAVLHGISALAIAADGTKTIEFSSYVENVCTELP